LSIVELIEEKQNNSELNRLLTLEKKKNAVIIEDLEEESKRSLQMESELEKAITNFEKERARVKNVNEGFDRLRRHLPASIYKKEKRLSKVETLRLAISYIQQLNSILKFQRQN